MKANDLAFVLLRVLAVYTFIRGLEDMLLLMEVTVPGLLNMFDDPFFLPAMVAASVISGAALVAAGFFLWMKADKLAEAMVSGRDAIGVSESIKEHHLYVLSLNLTGIVIIVHAIPPLLMALGQIALHAANRIPLSAAVYGNAWLQWIGIVIRLFLGLVLVVGAKGIYGAVRRIRSLGLSATGDDGEKETADHNTKDTKD